MFDDDQTKALLDELSEQDNQLIDLVSSYCSKFNPLSGSLSQVKRNLRNVREFVADSWLKPNHSGLTRVKPVQKWVSQKDD